MLVCVKRYRSPLASPLSLTFKNCTYASPVRSPDLREDRNTSDAHFHNLVGIVVSTASKTPARHIGLRTAAAPPVTVTFADPDLVLSCSEVAVIVAVPVPDGVKFPLELTKPPVADQFTSLE